MRERADLICMSNFETIHLTVLNCMRNPLPFISQVEISGNYFVPHKIGYNRSNRIGDLFYFKEGKVGGMGLRANWYEKDIDAKSFYLSPSFTSNIKR